MATKKAPTDADVLRQRTEERAYALWEGEGRSDGRSLDRCCQAVAETIASADMVAMLFEDLSGEESMAARVAGRQLAAVVNAPLMREVVQIG